MSKIRSELELLKIIASKPKNRDVVKGIGDDCAVYKSRAGFYVVTTDMIVEGDHFSLHYFTPREIGIKAMESNVSDIASMGNAKPLFAFISIALAPGASEGLLKGLYSGIHESAARHGIDILGGDTTHGAKMVVNITLVGHAASRKGIIYRSGARRGDLIFTTGKLGASTAGLKLFLKKIPGHAFVKRKHTQPRARMDVAAKIARVAHAMEDVSDGLASEVRNICLESKKGAIIYAESVPIDARTRSAAKTAGNDALDYALFGGEDFELVYTVPRAKRREAEKCGTMVGEITGKKRKIYLAQKGKLTLLKKFGYDHFAL